jgi:hypothetical protein
MTLKTLRWTLSRTLLVALTAAAAGCVLYGDAEEQKTCAEVVCGSNATCGDNAECYCDAGYAGNPFDGCKAIEPDVDENCSLDCGQNAYCSEGGCFCELDHVAVCGANAGCMPESRLCDDKEDCPNAADEAPAVCGTPIFQDWVATDNCDDGEDFEWRLYALERDWAWPADGASFYTTGFYVDAYQTIQCFEGETICYAAASGSIAWGFNLDGSGECDDCCFACTEEVVYIGPEGYLECGG